MQISDISVTDVVNFLGLEETDDLIEPIMEAATNFIMSYTGLTDEEMDEHADLWIAYMTLCQDMHDNRSYVVDNTNVNRVVSSVLDMHCRNLL